MIGCSFVRPNPEETFNVMIKETVNTTQDKNPTQQEQRWRLSRLAEVHGRRFLLRAQAIELCKYIIVSFLQIHINFLYSHILIYYYI